MRTFFVIFVVVSMNKAGAQQQYISGANLNIPLVLNWNFQGAWASTLYLDKMGLSLTNNYSPTEKVYAMVVKVSGEQVMLNGKLQVSSDWWKRFLTQAIPDSISVDAKDISGINVEAISMQLGLKDSSGRGIFILNENFVPLKGEWVTCTWDMKDIIKNNPIANISSVGLTARFYGEDSTRIERTILWDNLVFYYPLEKRVVEGFGDGSLGLVNIEYLSEVPKGFALFQNYPNPFNPTTTIKFTIPQKGNVKIEVYDIMGKLINTLINKDMNSGSYTVTWDGKNNSGQQVGSGIYFYRIQAADKFNAVKKMILLK